VILLWGIPSDPNLAAVETVLRSGGVPCLFLDQRATAQTSLTLEVDARVSGSLTVFDQTIALERITAVYARPYELARLGLDIGAAAHATSLHHALSVWLDVTPAFVLNRPRDMALNSSKPYQAALIEAAGLRTPETLLTTDPEAVRGFRARHGAVVYKSISAVRSVVARIGAADEDRIGDVVSCPTQFQRWIGGFEVRVHVVDGEEFASRIVTEADDYRYAELSGQQVVISTFDLPDPFAAQCRCVTNALGYVIAGLDLRCENGVWYCFEVNPSPSFAYYEHRTGQPIAAAVARLLADAVKSRMGPDPGD
jgi:glutathione synthase/RimK-type ligase-like ATP-grasp enzyme